MDGWMNEEADLMVLGWMDGWMKTDKWMERQVDGWMDE